MKNTIYLVYKHIIPQYMVTYILIAIRPGFYMVLCVWEVTSRRGKNEYNGYQFFLKETA